MYTYIISYHSAPCISGWSIMSLSGLLSNSFEIKLIKRETPEGQTIKAKLFRVWEAVFIKCCRPKDWLWFDNMPGRKVHFTISSAHKSENSYKPITGWYWCLKNVQIITVYFIRWYNVNIPIFAYQNRSRRNFLLLLSSYIIQ